MRQKRNRAGGKAAAFAALLGAALALAGCGGPTYGTGQTSSQQLVNDFSNITKWGSLNTNTAIDDKPRPHLVQPTAADLSRPLPAPQQAVAGPGNPNWPESPEQRRARLREEATQNSNNPNYVSPIIMDDAPQDSRYLPSGIDRARERQDNMPSAATTKKQTELYKKLRKEESASGSAKTRKYLSDPPVDYFKPSPNAPQGELGESEDDKENAKKGKTSLFGK